MKSGLELLGHRESSFAVRCDFDQVTVQLKLQPVHLRDRGIVLNHKDPFGPVGQIGAG